MLIPKAIQIGRVRYDITVKPRPASPHNGAINYTLGTIWINGGRPPRRLAHSFWHETVHGILRDMQHPFSTDEKFVDAFAKRLNQVVHTGRVE